MKRLMILSILFSLFLAVSAQGDRLSPVLTKVYPNPLKSHATLKIDQSIELTKNEVSVHFYNLIGAEVFRKENIQNSSIQLDRSNFKSGVYLYQLKSNGKVLSTGKLTVN